MRTRCQNPNLRTIAARHLISSTAPHPASACLHRKWGDESGSDAEEFMSADEEGEVKPEREKTDGGGTLIHEGR